MFGLPETQAVYLDYAATTPVAPEVIDAMRASLTDAQAFANPSSNHAYGEAAEASIVDARASLSDALGVAPDTLVFTSGATESDNLAIIGAARYRQADGRHLITSRVEHKAVIDAFGQLEREGFEVTWLEPTADGLIEPSQVAEALRDDTTLVSLMWVNNEIGVINDIPALAALLAEHPALFHVDAAQAFGKIPLALDDSGIDLVSLTAHKCYGPKGIGALYLAPRHGVQIEPLLFGGGQQNGLRPGTLPTHQIVGFGKAATLVAARQAEDWQRLKVLGDDLLAKLLSVPGVHLNGSRERRLPWLINVSVEGVNGESLLAAMQPVALATGSACNAASGEASFVLRALGRSDILAQASLRFSLGRGSDQQAVDMAADRFQLATERLRSLSGDLIGGAIP